MGNLSIHETLDLHIENLAITAGVVIRFLAICKRFYVQLNMPYTILFAWIGNTDLKAARGELKGELGPIAMALAARSFSHIILISNYTKEEEKRYLEWLKGKTSASIRKHHVHLTSPTDFRDIYNAVTNTIKEVKRMPGAGEFRATYHLSPGTPAMAAVWIILSKTLYPAEIIESSLEKGVQTVSLPFEISADYVPDIVIPADDQLLKLTQGLQPESPEFAAIIHRSREMKRAIAQARRLAVHDVPVLIQGESGTGKELFARAIHAASPRGTKPFIAVNCGSIPPDLVESEFFGHKKGAFTGAIHDRRGHFANANQGTLFLDEIGELSLPAQVKLLRAIQEGKIVKIGASSAEPVDVRIIAATNRDLIEQTTSGKFREDLFHRIAVGVLHLPPLRERQGDLNLIIDYVLENINKKFEGKHGWKHKRLSAGARNLMCQHSWPGNIREMYNTLARATILIADETVETEDLREALLPLGDSRKDQAAILNRRLGDDFRLRDVLSEVARHYLQRAVAESRGNKTTMATLLGFPNYQTVNNWLTKYGIVDS